MRKTLIIGFVVFILIFSCACAVTTAPSNGSSVTLDKPDSALSPALDDASALPAATDTPAYSDESIPLSTTTVYYPEGSDETSAEYILRYTLPVFGTETDITKKMSDAVLSLEDDILTRVSEEHIPFADRADGEQAPSTVITCQVDSHRGYTNAIFTQTVSYGVESEISVFTLVLSPEGNETSLAAASGIFSPDAIVAQQVWNIIDVENIDMYFGDISPDAIAPVLDLYNAYKITDDGYTVYAQTGTLAPESYGILEFSFKKSALYPDFIGGAMSIEEYEAVAAPLNTLAAACAPYYESFEGGSPSAFVASSFLSKLIIDSTDVTDANAYIEYPKSEYSALFASYFSGDFPTDIAQMGDGTLESDSSYSIPILPQAAYSLRLDDGARNGNELTLSGMLMCGTPGTMNTSELAAITVVLEASPASPCMFRFVSFSIK